VTRIEIGKGHGSGATPVSGVTHVDDRTVTFVMLPQSAIGTGVPDEVTVYGGSSDSSWQVLTGNDELTYLYVDDGPPLHD
jgi:hypothetical protein